MKITNKTATNSGDFVCVLCAGQARTRVGDTAFRLHVGGEGAPAGFSLCRACAELSPGDIREAALARKSGHDRLAAFYEVIADGAGRLAKAPEPGSLPPVEPMPVTTDIKCDDRINSQSSASRARRSRLVTVDAMERAASGHWPHGAGFSGRK